MEDAHSAESNGKSIFRFLCFQLWLLVFIIYSNTPRFSGESPTKKNRSKGVKFTGKMRNELKIMKTQFSDF